MAIKLYCQDIPREGDRSPTKMQELIEKAMEQVRKEHYLAFCKHLHVCDMGFGIKFVQEIQAHYDNNPKLEMLIEKIQMLMYSTISKEYKVSWLKQWNESKVLKESKKFP